MKDNGLDIFRYTPPYGPEDMQREIDILRAALAKSNAERDEARREICMNATKEPYRQMCGSGILLPQDEAAWRGWDCFKEVE